MICTGANTEANIKKVLAYAAKIISKYVIDVGVQKQQASK
jgi:hypothetical protein